MNVWIVPLSIVVAGGIGGLVNAFMSGSGTIVLPAATKDETGAKVWRPNIFATVGIGSVAALVSWAIYGTAAGASVMNGPLDLTWANLGAAILVGIGGTRWLSAEVEKTILKQTAVIAARKNADPHLAEKIAASDPASALAAAVSAQTPPADPAVPPPKQPPAN